MKTIKLIKSEIDDLITQIKELEKTFDKIDLKKAKNFKNKITELRKIILYLESVPNEKFLHDEKERIEKRLIELKKLFDSLIPPGANMVFINDLKKSFSKECGIIKMKDQLKLLEYIIS